MGTTSGLLDFKSFLKDTQEIGGWALSGALAAPILAALAGIAPPWPPATWVWTALLELTVLILAYHHVSKMKYAELSKLFRKLLPVLGLALIVYLTLFSLFVFEIPTTQEQIVKGFWCTSAARSIAPQFNDTCPFLGRDALAAATYEVDRLWTSPSITGVRLAMLFSWFAFFLSFIGVLAAFVVYQRKRRITVTE